MNRLLYISLVLLLVACNTDTLMNDEGETSPVELTGIHAEVYGGTTTRAVSLSDTVGRIAFKENDCILFTNIQRTQQPIEAFTYNNGIEYKRSAESSWKRTTTDPERIYWSDAESEHTFKAYACPQGDSTPEGFDWKKFTSSGVDWYFGSLGNPTLTSENYFIDYTNDPLTEADNTAALKDAKYHTGNEKICKDDILLACNTAQKADLGGQVATVRFYHGLCNVRVIVNISGFSASHNSEDSKSVVSHLQLQDMPTMYKWMQTSYATQALTSDDQEFLNTAYTGVSPVPSWDQKKTTKAWIRHPEGRGTGNGKTFTFYALAVPETLKTQRIVFDVTYPDPMNPQQNVTKPYSAQIANVEYRAGHCTTITISLNHQNDAMTVGAEYTEWQFINTPDEGELKKNPTFLSYIPTSEDDRIANKIYIASDTQANVDDATWLYNAGTAESPVIKDIYGNEGTESNPFTIKTADQLLALAYEVKKGRDFQGQCIKLDADITMQKEYDLPKGEDGKVIESQLLSWEGIGDDTHLFKGIFYGSERRILRLYGAALFNHLGHDAVVDRLDITDVVKISGTGCIAETNDGIVCGCHIEGDIVSTDKSKSYCGSLVGNNDNGVVIACAHIGDTKGYGTVGALVGNNNGMLAMCYNAGDAKNAENGNAYAGVGTYTDRSIAYCCYFNSDLYTSTDYSDLSALIGHVAFPLTTAQMQSNSFVNATLGTEITTDSKTEEEKEANPIWYHYSLNAGITRIVQLLTYAANQQPDANGYVQVFLMPLKHSQAVWLKDHYTTAAHHFRYIPGTYPKLQ